MADLYGYNPYTGGYQYTSPISNMFQQPQAQTNPYTVRESGNVAEVLAAQINVGTTNVFLNLPAGEIYISKHDNMGKKEVSVYRFDQVVPQAILRQGKDAAPVDLSGVYAELAAIKAMINGGKADESNDEVNGTAKGRGKPAGGHATGVADDPTAGAK